jgi:hypothetical protein
MNGGYIITWNEGSSLLSGYYHLGMPLKKMSKTTTVLSQDYRYPGRQSNKVLVECNVLLVKTLF